MWCDFKREKEDFLEKKFLEEDTKSGIRNSRSAKLFSRALFFYNSFFYKLFRKSEEKIEISQFFLYLNLLKFILNLKKRKQKRFF